MIERELTVSSNGDRISIFQPKNNMRIVFYFLFIKRDKKLRASEEGYLLKSTTFDTRRA